MSTIETVLETLRSESERINPSERAHRPWKFCIQCQRGFGPNDDYSSACFTEDHPMVYQISGHAGVTEWIRALEYALEHTED